MAINDPVINIKSNNEEELSDDKDNTTVNEINLFKEIYHMAYNGHLKCYSIPLPQSKVFR
jgi:hypothetical protein